MPTGLQQCLLDRASFTGTNSLERRWILAACLSDSLGQDSVEMENAHLGGGIALDLAEMWSYGDVDLNLKAKNQEEKQ